MGSEKGAGEGGSWRRGNVGLKMLGGKRKGHVCGTGSSVVFHLSAREATHAHAQGCFLPPAFSHLYAVCPVCSPRWHTLTHAEKRTEGEETRCDPTARANGRPPLGHWLCAARFPGACRWHWSTTVEHGALSHVDTRAQRSCRGRVRTAIRA